MKTILRSLIPDRIMPTRILGGPFRGAIVQLNPRHSIRKILGIYEHELNGWLKTVLPHIDTVVDVGANEGYFTFGCAAAFRRMNKSGEIIAFEPESQAFESLRLGMKGQQSDGVHISIHKSFVGSEVAPGKTTLDELVRRSDGIKNPENALIKIDVEGAELEVIAGASLWLNPTNYFLIEVHWDETFLTQLNKTFFNRDLKLKQINQQALPILGHEARGRNQWWLVSEKV